MRIVVTGATGLVGSDLVTTLRSNGHDVTPLLRRAAAAGEASWDPATGVLDPTVFSGVDGVVHLAGDNIAKGRWNAAKKARIRDSRVAGTKLLAKAIANASPRPGVLVSASAIGFYGERGETPCDESAAVGTGFLPEVCQEWENATAASADAGVRVVNLRIGVVLTPKGGALAQMLLPFKLGLAGIIGSGKQYMSWIGLSDLVGAIVFALENQSLRGPVNAVAPSAATNLAFTKTLGKVLHRPTIFPMPAFAARLAFGEMADALLLASTRVEPKRLLDAGFTFQQPDLEAALRHELGMK